MTIERLIKAAQALVDSVQIDETGQLIGGKWTNGNGGLISAETNRRADECRRAITAARIDLRRSEQLDLPFQGT